MGYSTPQNGGLNGGFLGLFLGGFWPKIVFFRGGVPGGHVAMTTYGAMRSCALPMQVNKLGLVGGPAYHIAYLFNHSLFVYGQRGVE